MNHENYNEGPEDFVAMHGCLSIQQAIDFINFCDKAGYKLLMPADNGISLLLLKADYSKIKSEDAFINTNNIFESFYEEEKQENKKLKARVAELENILNRIYTTTGDAWKINICPTCC